MINLIVNDKQITVKEGTTLLDAVQSAGIDLPTLCSHPDLQPFGGCRLCSVEVSRNGRAWVTTACNTTAEDGITVNTESARATATRKLMAELLLARTPNVPAIQRIAASLGVEEARFPTDKPEEDCILCGLCVRACDQVAGHQVLGFVDRGPERVVTTAFGEYDPVCDDCNQCITYCPTGAITRLEGLAIGRKWYANAKKWVRTRKAVQYGLLAVFTLLFITTSQVLQLPINLSNLFSRFDPLQALMANIAAREVLPLYLPAIITIIATILFGRVWCGWVCPLGAILQLFGPVGTRKMQPWFRMIKYFFLIVIFGMALFGSLAFMWLDPITILVRGVADPISVILGIIEMPGFKVSTLLSMLMLVLVLVLNLVEKRFWCRYLCPLGALLGLGSKFAWIRRRVNELSCVKCGDCVGTCPMGAISPETIKNDPAECVMCLDCADAPCPKTAITYGRQPTPRWNHEFDPTRRELIGGAATAAAGVVLFNTGVLQTKADDLIRPPGVVDEADFLSKCIRCDQCVQACATHALHPVMFGTSWDSFWTPAINGQLGYCDYNCNRCGQICPAGAIPALTLEQKRKQVMGVAVLNESVCINCMVCEKACQLNAIDRTEVRKDGKMKPLPVILTDKCNGCGQCEFKCPAPPAIKVYARDKAPKKT